MNTSAVSKKREQEERALSAAFPLLQKLYGVIESDSDQHDSPDFCINVKAPNKHWGRKCQPFKVGVEVTTIDGAKVLAYFNDEKHSANEKIAQIENLKSGIISEQPFKRMDVKFDDSSISHSLLKKSDKYKNYSLNGVFREIIIICFSDFLKLNYFNENKQNLKKSVEFILHRQQFPFEKVLFVGAEKNASSIMIYDKKKSCPKEPIEFQTVKVDTSESGVLPFGMPINTDKALWGKPVVTPRNDG